MPTAEAKEEKRLCCRSDLEQAMRNYIEAAHAANHTNQGIAEDVADVLCDASDRQIIYHTSAIAEQP